MHVEIGLRAVQELLFPRSSGRSRTKRPLIRPIAWRPSGTCVSSVALSASPLELDHAAAISAPNRKTAAAR